MSGYSEKGAIFRSGDNRLVGVVAVPDTPSDIGVLIMVGGPQYRVGSHRQFTMLARSLAEAGIASLRFDYSGMGDSEGERCGFNEVEQDIAAALGHLYEHVPEMSGVVLWGLCDAASTALMYGHRDARICGLVLLNPWVHSGDYSPEVKLSHFYSQLLKGKDTWRRFVSGKIQVVPTMKEFAINTAAWFKKVVKRSAGVPLSHSWVIDMLKGLKRFKGEILFVLSENDFTTREFQSLIANDKSWHKAIRDSKAILHNLAESDHTFSDIRWHNEVVRLTIEFVKRQHTELRESA